MRRETVSIVPDGVLAYGIQLPVQALSTRVAMPWEREDGTVDDMVRVAQACDAAGFLYVAVCHHVAIPREPAEMMSTHVVRSGRDARVTSPRTRTRTRLMTNVYVAAYRHPLETAKAFATLDALSDGRLIVRRRRRPRRRRVRRARRPVRGAGRDHRRGDRRDRRRVDRRVGAARRRALEVRRRRSAAASGAAAAPADLDRRLGQARAAPRRARRRRLDPAGDAARPAAPTTSRTSCASATRCGRARCPRSATTGSRTSVSPRGTLPEVRDARQPTASSTGSTGSARSASRTCRCASRRARPTSSATRSTRVRRRDRSAPHARRAELTRTGGTSMPYLCMRHDFRAPAFGPGVDARDLRGRARAVRVGRPQRLRPRSCSRSTTASTTAGMPAPLTMAGVRARPHRSGRG